MIPLSRRALHSLGHEIFTTHMTVELDGHAGCHAELRCEVEFYREFDAIAPTRDEPGEPAQYVVAAIRAYQLLRENGVVTTVPKFLPTPDWLEDLLCGLVDPDRLGEEAEL